MKGHSIASRHLAMQVPGRNSKLGCGEKETEERVKKKDKKAWHFLNWYWAKDTGV